MNELFFSTLNESSSASLQGPAKEESASHTPLAPRADVPEPSRRRPLLPIERSNDFGWVTELYLGSGIKRDGTLPQTLDTALFSSENYI